MADKQKNIEIKKSDNFTLFLPAFIDDYGFTPEEFRVFTRICRRAHGEKDCFESIPNLAKALHISEALVRRALKVLEECKAISRHERKGKSDVFDFNECKKWKPKSELSAIRKQIESDLKAKDRERKKKPLLVMETTGVTGYGNVTTPLTETQPLLVTETTDEGTPSEGTPLKGGKHLKPLPKKSIAIPVTDLVSEETDSIKIYREFYPDTPLAAKQIELLKTEIKDSYVWRKTLVIWRGNLNVETNIGNLIDRYHNEKAREANNHSPPPQKLKSGEELLREREQFKQKSREAKL